MSKINAGYASQAHFAMVPSANIRRSKFKRQSTYKATMNAGELIPFYVDEVLPGDTFDMKASIFGRLSTPIVPFMDDLFIDTHFFFVPNRLLWENWERFNGAQDSPSDSTDYLIPTVRQYDPNSGINNDGSVFGDPWPVHSMADYFGLPTQVPSRPVNALFFRAYNLIWNEWFRDENLQDAVEVPLGDGPDDSRVYNIQKRGKRKDYFTSALPWPQKGPGIELPLGTTAPVYGNGSYTYFCDCTTEGASGINGEPYNIYGSTSDVIGGTFLRAREESGGEDYLPQSARLGVATKEMMGQRAGEAGLYADLEGASAVTINSFRMAFQMQSLLETDARCGSRYTEILRGHFGVISPDSRLQRPEYLGGSSTRLGLQAVPQTGSTDTTTPQGNLAAYGVFNDVAPRWTKSFVEHGIIMGFVSVRSNLTYQQGIPKMFQRKTRWDFYWPNLAHLGEQAILNSEIYSDGSAQDLEVFGYQERWAEYRYGISKICGKLRSNDPQTLDVWHLSQYFENRPTLSSSFIEENPPLDRVLAVTDEPQIIFDALFDVDCTRPMPTYSIPGLVTHL